MDKMKPKSSYPQDNLPVKGGGRYNFYNDIHLVANNRKLSVPKILHEFFQSGDFTKEEMGTYASYLTSLGEVIPACVLLIQALQITEAQASQQNILVEYFSVSKHNPQAWGWSWTIDNLVNWLPGTLFPESRRQLDLWLADISKDRS